MNIDANDGFRDLAPLSPRAEAGRWEAMVAAVEAAAASELARRAALQPPGLLMVLTEWRRSAVAVATAMAAAAIAVLMLANGGPAAPAPGLAEALGVPQVVASWVEGGERPTLEELVIAFEGEGYGR